MGVTPEEVRRIAELARLDLSDEEVAEGVRDLGDILRHVDVLGAVDLPDDRDRFGSRFRYPRASLRPDEPGRDDLITAGPGAFAPAFRDGYFLVPRLGSHSHPSGGADGDGERDSDTG